MTLKINFFWKKATEVGKCSKWVYSGTNMSFSKSSPPMQDAFFLVCGASFLFLKNINNRNMSIETNFDTNLRVLKE